MLTIQQHRSRLQVLLLPIVMLLVTACAQTPTPDLEQLFRSDQPIKVEGDFMQPPVVIIPGLLGSRLVDAKSGQEQWPGGTLDVAFSQYEAIEMPVDGSTITPDALPSSLMAGGIAESALGRDFYGRIIDTLVRYGGYQRADVGEPISTPNERRVYVFDYDWRQDNVTTVRTLAKFLEAIRRDYNDPALKFDIVAHSMGGLIARYFLRYGTEDVLINNHLKVTWAGADWLNKVMLLGTPNLGSLSAIEGFVLGQKVGFSRIPQEVVATIPSTYQLFPHRIVNWLIDGKGQPMDADPFDIATWQKYQWNIFDPVVRDRVIKNRGEEYYANLTQRFVQYAERARRFSWSLTVCPDYDESLGKCGTGSVEPPVRLVVFGGSCTQTPARAMLEKVDGKMLLRLHPSEVLHQPKDLNLVQLMLQPGDGTVTKPSLLARDALNPLTPRHAYSYFPLAYAFLLCEEHAMLTGNVHFQNNLLDVLLTRALPWELHLDHPNRK